MRSDCLHSARTVPHSFRVRRAGIYIANNKTKGRAQGTMPGCWASSLVASPASNAACACVSMRGLSGGNGAWGGGAGKGLLPSAEGLRLIVGQQGWPLGGGCAGVPGWRAWALSGVIPPEGHRHILPKEPIARTCPMPSTGAAGRRGDGVAGAGEVPMPAHTRCAGRPSAPPHAFGARDATRCVPRG